jgi:hypothetical protein
MNKAPYYQSLTRFEVCLVNEYDEIVVVEDTRTYTKAKAMLEDYRNRNPGTTFLICKVDEEIIE